MEMSELQDTEIELLTTEVQSLWILLFDQDVITAQKHEWCKKAFNFEELNLWYASVASKMMKAVHLRCARGTAQLWKFVIV